MAYLSNYVEPIEKYPQINQFYPQGHYMISSVMDLPTPVNRARDSDIEIFVTNVSATNATTVTDMHVRIEKQSV